MDRRIELTAFVRAALAIELGDTRPAGRVMEAATTLVGPVRPSGEGGQVSAGQRRQTQQGRSRER